MRAPRERELLLETLDLGHQHNARVGPRFEILAQRSQLAARQWVLCSRHCQRAAGIRTAKEPAREQADANADNEGCKPAAEAGEFQGSSPHTLQMLCDSYPKEHSAP